MVRPCLKDRSPKTNRVDTRSYGLHLSATCKNPHADKYHRPGDLPSLRKPSIYTAPTDILTCDSSYLLRLPMLFRSLHSSTVTFMQRSSSLTAAGPSRNCTGFPVDSDIMYAKNNTTAGVFVKQRKMVGPGASEIPAPTICLFNGVHDNKETNYLATITP